MLALLLDAQGKREKVGLVHAGSAHHVSDLGRAMGDGARLVEHDACHIVSVFERLGTLDENALLGTATRAHHNRSRGCQAKGARAADDKHRDTMDNGLRHIHARGNEPDAEHDDRRRNDRRHKHARNAIGDALDGGLAARGVIHQLDDMGERRIVAHACGAHANIARDNHRTCGKLASRSLVHRHALARERRFVERGRAVDHHAVNRHTRARANDQDVAHLHLLNRHLTLCAVVAHEHRRLGSQVHERGDGVGRAALCARLEVLAQRDEREDHAGALEVQVHCRRMRPVHVAMAERIPNAVQGRDAVKRGRSRAQRHKRVHVGGLVNETLEAVAEELEVDGNNRDDEQELCESKRHHVLVAQENTRQGPAIHMAHVQVKQRNGKDEAHDEADAHALCLGLGDLRRRGSGRSLLSRRTSRCALRGTRDGAVSGLVHRVANGGQYRLVARVRDLHAVLEQVDHGLFHAGHRARRLLDASRTRRAGHTCDVEYPSCHLPSSKPMNQVHRLVDDLVMPRANLLYYACLHVVAQNHLAHAMHGTLRSGKLREDVAAIAVVVNHRLHAVELADGTVEPALQVSLKLLAARRGLVLGAATCLVLRLFFLS